LPQFNKFKINKNSFNKYLDNLYLLLKNSNFLFKNNEILNNKNKSALITKDVKDDIIKINNDIDKSVFKRRLYNKTSSAQEKQILSLFAHKYIGMNRSKKLIINMLDLNKKIFIQNKHDNDFYENEKKNIKMRKSK
jgi:hypothetical protein